MSQMEITIKQVYMSHAEFDIWKKTHPNTPALEKKIVTGITCDTCGKRIKNREKYLCVTTGHDAWSAESIDSIKVHDVCSPECLTKFIDEFRKCWETNENYQTDYIRIESTKAHYVDTEDATNDDS